MIQIVNPQHFTFDNLLWSYHSNVVPAESKLHYVHTLQGMLATNEGLPDNLKDLPTLSCKMWTVIKKPHNGTKSAQSEAEK